MSTLLDVQLPPLAELGPASSLDYRLSDRQGHTLATGNAERAQLLREAKGAGWRLHLHEDDSLALAVALPPLTGKRLSAAVRCAVQGLVLGDIGQVHVAHGPRQGDGQVAVAWLGLAQLAHLQEWLQAGRIRPQGVFTQPAEDRPVVDLGGGLQGPSHTLDVGRTVAVWSVAVLVWCLGLNLHAMQLANEGDQLRARMVAQVRAAFPNLPVVLNPLQQARQQLQGGQGATGTGLVALLDGAGKAMPFLAGNVTALDYADGELRITPLAEGRKAPADMAWQTQLAAQGIEASAGEQGWTLRAGGAANEALAHVD